MRPGQPIAAFLCFALAACSDKTSLPSDLQLLCTSASECPTGMGCNKAGRCVPQERVDEAGPLLVSSQPVAPTIGNAGARFAVSFEVSKQLAADPQVYFETATGKFDFALDEAATSRADRRFGYSFTSNDPNAEGLQTVFVRFEDGDGNLGIQRLGAFTLDLHAPGVVAATVQIAPALLRPGEACMLRAGLTELVKQARVVARRPSGDEELAQLSVAEGVLSGTWTAPKIASDETAQLFVTELIDLAGNAASGEIALGSVQVDGSAPTVSTLVPNDTYFSHVAGRSTLSFTFSINDPSATFEAFVGSQKLSAADCSATSPVTCQYDLSGDTQSGVRPVTVIARDEVGNAGFNQTSVTFDFDPPSVVADSSGVSGTFEILPGPGVAVRQLTAVGKRSIIRTRFTASEPLAAGSPTVTFGPSAMALTLLPGTAYAFSDAFQPPAAPVAGEQWQVTVHLVDLAGNSTDQVLTFAGGDPLVDTAEPAAPDTATARAIVYTRAPWGTLATNPGNVVPLFQIVGAPVAPATAGPVEPGATVLALDKMTGEEIERATADASGSFSMTLSRNYPSVQLVAIDGAGNASAPAAVKDQDFVMTAAGIEPGSAPTQNPSSLYSTPWLSATPIFDASTMQEAGFGQTRASSFVSGGTGAAASLSQTLAIPLSAASTPSLVTNVTATFDLLRGRVLVYGGEVGSATLGALWEWRSDSSRFAPLASQGARPSPRRYSAFAYDPVRGRAVLFGGADLSSSPSVFFQDLWEYDSAADRWIDRTPSSLPASWPSKREGARAAFDPNTGKILLLGGRNSGTPAADPFWAWDGATGTFTRLPDPPNPVTGGAAVFDASANKLVAFGGVSGATYLDGLATYDPVLQQWAQVAKAGSWPGARWLPLAWYDSARNKVCLSGGVGASGAIVDLWDLDTASGAFTSVTTPAGWPTNYSWRSTAFDPSTRRAVHIGSNNGTSLSVLEWDASAAQLIDRSPPWQSPSARRRHGLAYDEGRDLFVAVGGESATAGLGDTWEYSPGLHRWTQRTATGLPAAGVIGTLLYDPSRTALWMVGTVAFTSTGSLEIWRLDKGATSWVQMAHLGTTWPSARVDSGIVFARSLDKILVSGGRLGSTMSVNITNELWQFDPVAGTFANLTPATLPSSWPQSLRQSAASWDEGRGKMLVFGRIALNLPHYAYEWDPATSTWSSTYVPMPLNDELRLSYDSVRGKHLIYGGPGGGTSDHLYQWDAAAGKLTDLYPTPVPSLAPVGSVQFSQALSADWPMGRMKHALAFDRRRGSLVLLGGDDGTGGGYLNDAWLFDLGLGRRPAFLWHAPFGASGADASAVTFSALSAEVVATGECQPVGGSKVRGVELLAWDAAAGQFASLASETAASGTITLRKQIASDAGVRRMLLGAQREAVLAIAAPAQGGTPESPAQAVLDALQLTFSFRLP